MSVSKAPIVLPAFHKAVNDCMYSLQVAGVCLYDDKHREKILKLIEELDLEFKAIYKLINDSDGKDSKN